jgi:hypothetical protein
LAANWKKFANVPDDSRGDDRPWVTLSIPERVSKDSSSLILPLRSPLRRLNTAEFFFRKKKKKKKKRKKKKSKNRGVLCRLVFIEMGLENDMFQIGN